jgi:hypothetical protein
MDDSKKGLTSDMKLCCTCRRSKPLKDFWKSHRRCKECQREAIKASVARRRRLEPPLEKKCPQCQKRKASEQFYRSAGRHDGLNPWCKDCTKMHHQQSYRENPARHRGYSLKRYGADAPLRYQQLYELQNGRCAGETDAKMRIRLRTKLCESAIEVRVRGRASGGRCVAARKLK